MITKIGFAGIGDNSPGIPKNFTISSLALRKGALVSKTVSSSTHTGGTANLALFTQTTATSTLPLLGVTNGSRLSTDTQASVLLVVSGDLLEFDVTEIVNATNITATGGSSTTFVCSTLQGLDDNSFIGAVFKVVSMASGDQAPGALLTATGYTNSNPGTVTFASLGSTGFASGDKVLLVSLNNDYVCGNVGCYLNSTYMDSIDMLNAIKTTAGSCFVRIIGTNCDQGQNPISGTFNGTKLQGVALTGFDTVNLLGITGI